MFIDKQRKRSKKKDGEGLREQGTQGEVMERRRYHRIQGRRSHRRRRWIDERRRVATSDRAGVECGGGWEGNGVRVRVGVGAGGSRFIYGEEGGVLGPVAASLLAVGPLRACRYFAGRAVPACGPRVQA